jgi:UDP-N-acetylmuramoyl-tripeptide--D-alanyl-D-alanine ligase
MTGVSHDTRTTNEGELYISIVGERCDGHDFVRQAFEHGAAAAMVASSFSGESEWPLLRVADTRRALRDLACAYRNCLTGTIFAVTGSVGKTTVKEMLAGMLARLGPTSATKGNWNNDIGLPLSLLAMGRDDMFGVFEVAMNAPGEIAALCEILQPGRGVMTSVGLAHCARFDGASGIAREKAAMLRALPADGFAVLAGDEEWSELFCGSTVARTVTVAMSGAADYTAETDDAGRLVIRYSEESFRCTLPLPGRHIQRDALLAAAAAIESGVGAKVVVDALENMTLPPMRWERISVGGVDFINDAYNANPLSMNAAIETFAETDVSGRRWLVLGGMRELGAVSHKAHFALGGVVLNHADFLVAVGVDASVIVEGACAAGFEKARMFECEAAEDAAELLAQSTERGDAVLLKASRAEGLEGVINEFQKIRND